MSKRSPKAATPRRERPLPNKAETAQLLAESEEVGRIMRARPNAKELAASLGPFKTCDVPTLVTQEGGKFEVNFTSEKATPEENRRRIGLVNEAMKETRDLQTDRTHRQAATEDRILIHDVRNGDVREIPAAMEDRIARKKWARPGARRRTYFFMGG